MFTLWYSVLSYKEYRDTIWEKLKCNNSPIPKETAIVCPLPPKTVELSTPKPTPVKQQQQQSVVKPGAPQSPSTPPISRVPQQKQESPQISTINRPQPPSFTPFAKDNSVEITKAAQKLDPPPKPPRSPSPHPISSQVDIEYEEDEESEESSGPEEEENSVLFTPQRKQPGKTVNEFIKREKTT